MKRVPANRYMIFALIVCAGATIDLWSKHVVFEDLGYPRNQIVFQPGQLAKAFVGARAWRQAKPLPAEDRVIPETT